ncbi:hypothetical protein [Lysinibacillus sp. NPDC093216]|uniref:hypothetical protein n=1 Tax=Lysinibacillus sp. NPDC093216 TaxID=3390576 RepID=UPI003D06B67E
MELNGLDILYTIESEVVKVRKKSLKPKVIYISKEWYETLIMEYSESIRNYNINIPIDYQGIPVKRNYKCITKNIEIDY